MSNLKNILPQVFQCSLLHDVHSELSNGFDSNYVITEDLCCHFGTNKKKNLWRCVWLRWWEMTLNVMKRKVKLWNATTDNIETQALTISVETKSNRYLQLMDHQGRASPNHHYAWWWKRFRSPTLLFWVHYWP